MFSGIGGNDVVAQTLPDLPDLTPDQAEAWVAASLSESRALGQHEEQLFPDDNDPAARGSAESLRAAWVAWIESAERVLSRIRPLLAAKRHIAGAYDLDYAIGRARAMLNLSPEALRQRREQVRSGQTQSIEEVRRELRASPGR
jgi:hypothetical protein